MSRKPWKRRLPVFGGPSTRHVETSATCRQCLLTRPKTERKRSSIVINRAHGNEFKDQRFRRASDGSGSSRLLKAFGSYTPALPHSHSCPALCSGWPPNH